MYGFLIFIEIGFGVYGLIVAARFLLERFGWETKEREEFDSKF